MKDGVHWVLTYPIGYVTVKVHKKTGSGTPVAENAARRYANGCGVASTLGIETRAIVLNGDG
jgi:hypothetical protein